MSASILIRPEDLLAAAVTASTDDTRYAMSGVYLERRAREGVTIVSTDGRRLTMGELPHDPDAVRAFPGASGVTPDPDSPFPGIILPLAVAKDVGKSAKRARSRGGPAASILLSSDGITCQISWVGDASSTGTSAKLIDGHYPPFRDVFPADGESKATSTICWNPSLLADMGKIHKLTGSKDSPAVEFTLHGSERQTVARWTNTDTASIWRFVIMPITPDPAAESKPRRKRKSA